jgi:c-di-GMP-binding flagellar brake protein YcgR
MGTRIGRIVKDFVFKSIIETKAPVDIVYHKHRALGRFVDVTEESLEVEVVDGSLEGLARGDAVQVFFHFQNNFHAFQTSLLGFAEGAGKRLLLADPEGLYKNLQRKYERIRVPEGTEIYFLLHGKRVDLGFPKAHRARTPVPRAAGGAEAPRLEGLVTGFKAEAADRWSTNRIVMFRERQPSGPEEALVAALGSVLWLPTLEEGLPETESIPDVPLVTRLDLETFNKSRGAAENVAGGWFAQLLISKRAKGVFAEAASPILYGEYVLGCIVVANTLPSRERIDREEVLYLWEFSLVLAGALERHGYVANGASENRRYDAQVVDMSGSGLLFRHPSEELAMELLVNSDIELHLVVEGTNVRVLGRVRRKHQEPGQIHYGVQFTEIDPKDFSRLFRFLYGRDPAEKDETQWEGGAPAPRVDLFGDRS